MRTLFCVRPATRNIGNDVINKATADLLYDAFGSDTGIVNIPALQGPQFGGFTARQVFDMNRFADGVVVGGGNLLENGQLAVDLQALSALRVPMMLIGLSHGRIYDRTGELVARSDSLPAATIRALVAKACVTLVRDDASRALLETLGLAPVDVGGCPTLFLAESPRAEPEDAPIIISVRHPGRMNIPPALQWRVAEDVRGIIAGLRARFARQILIACHDYADIEFASGFSEVPLVYYDDVERYVQALRGCWLSITYRLHAFLPCLAFGTPSIHLSYDERGASMVATAGMSTWDVDMMREPDIVRAVLVRAASSDEYRQQRCAARPRLEWLHQTTKTGVARFVDAVDVYARARGLMIPMTAVPDPAGPQPWLRLASRDLPEVAALHPRVVEEIFTGVGVVAGETAAAALRVKGISALHEVFDARDVSALRDHVLEALRPNLLAMAVAVGRRVLGWGDDFFVDDYLILRINFPYEVARKADATAENPGIGRVSPWMREAAKVRRVIDPVFDPKGYHKGHPPAAWAHGPHLDSWAGHSKDGRNIWWAVGEVPAEAGMILYPELAGADLPVDPRSLYLQSGYALPKPTYLPLDAGDMLVFDPEILHGTHLNLTDKTRVAVSLRLNVRQPTFDPDCFYAREFWRRASDIEAGRYAVVQHFKREQHLAAAAPRSSAPRPPRTAMLTLEPPAERGALVVGAASLVPEGGRLPVQVAGRAAVIVRRNGQLAAFDAACPHYGVSLADGAADDTTMFCPACGVGFDLASGCSASPSLTLRRLAVRERDGTILLDLDAAGSS